MRWQRAGPRGHNLNYSFRAHFSGAFFLGVEQGHGGSCTHLASASPVHDLESHNFMWQNLQVFSCTQSA